MLLSKIYSAWTENTTKSDQCPPCKHFIRASNFSSLQNGNVIADKRFDTCKQHTWEPHAGVLDYGVQGYCGSQDQTDFFPAVFVAIQ